jgi:protease I
MSPPPLAAWAADSTKKADLSKVKGLRVAILVADGFEQVEMTSPRKALDAAGAKTTLVAPHDGLVKAWDKTDWGKKFSADLALDKAKAADFDALVLPSGVMGPDKLRINDKAVAFVKAFHDAGKPIAAICHGPWTLIEAGAVKGRKMTSWPSLKNDLRNACATWVDEEVVTDKGLVTSRKPDDLPAFERKMLEEFAEGRHQRRK